MTSTTTVSSDFIRCCFFRAGFFVADLGLALPTARFVAPLCADFAAFCALPVLLARFFGCAFARFFRLAMISSQTPCVLGGLKQCMR